VFIYSHDDMAEWLRAFVMNNLSKVNLLDHLNNSQVDIPRLLQGKVGGQVKE